MLSPSLDRPKVSRVLSCAAQAAAAVLFIFWPILAVCQAQGGSVLCHDGNANFDAEFRTGIKVHVGAARNGGPATLATRACAATLSWESQQQIVAANASQLDLDAFGVDFGDGIPAATFQVKKTAADCCMEYRIYSIEKPPRLLRTITGGEFFRASDVDLDGRVEIWTNDGAAADGFERLTLAELDFPPTVVFRFAHGQLLDVSGEFQSYYDDEIARIKSGIRPQDLEDFKNSDGKLAATPTPESAERLHRLRVMKIKVLEIVWAYLYNGREQDAWRSLGEMWPAADVDRIRAALLKMRALGVHGQADGNSAGLPQGKKKRAIIFDAATWSATHRLEVVPPRAILLERPPDSEAELQTRADSEAFLELIIDAAGKVRSATVVDKAHAVPAKWIEAALTWKFMPALKDGKPVACRMRIAVSPKQ